MDLHSKSQDHSDTSQQEGGLPEVSSTPCFIVLDSQAEGADDGRGSTTEARASRLKQLDELTKNTSTKPSMEMELSADIKSQEDRKDEKKVSSLPTGCEAGLGIQSQILRDDTGICEEEEEEDDDDDEVTSTQDDLFDEEKKLQVKPEDFLTPSTSKDASHIHRGTPSQDVHSTQKDASHLICTPSETVGSLRFSGVVLANETSTSGSGSSINVVFPSPEAYGPAPIIIPSTPTRPDTSNEDPMELSDNDIPRADLPHIPVKRKSTTTSDESEDFCRIPAWQQELNLQQKRKEEEAGTQDSWNNDDTGSKKRSLSASIDSANPSSEHSESIHKSSLELEESLLQQQQPPMPSTTDESSVQSTTSKLPIGTERKDSESHSAPSLSAPSLGLTGISTALRDGKSSSGSHPKKPASLPEGVVYATKRSVGAKEQAKLKELSTQDQSTGFEKTPSEAEFDDRTRLGVQKQEKGSGDAVQEAVIEIIDDEEEEEEEEEGGDKKEDAEVGMDVEPSDDWHLRLSPSQTQTQTQYSFAHREFDSKDIMSQKDPSQAKDVEEGDVPQQQKTVQSDQKATVSRQATPWHSTQADDGDDEVSIVIPESEKLDENKENESAKQNSSDSDGGREKVMKESSKKKSSESGEGMEDSVFLEGDAQLPSDGRLRLGQLGESDNPSPITGFNLSVPKDGAMLRPLSSMTSQLSKKGQWTDGTPRHSTPKADEMEGTDTKREVASTPDKETPKTTSKSSSALVVSAVIDMDSAESSEIPAFNLRNPADCDELLKEAKESPSKRQKSVFSRVVEATKTAKSNTRSRKQTDPIDKDPFSLSKPKTKLILGKKRNQQSLTAQDDQPRVMREEASTEKEMAIEVEHGDEGEASDVEMDDNDPATIPLEYHPDSGDQKEQGSDVEVVEETGVLKTRQEETQRYGGNDEAEADIEMDVDAEGEKINKDIIEERIQEDEKMQDERMEEEIYSKGHQVIVSQERRRRDPYEFTESQSNKTPTPMKTWASKEDTVPKEKLPSRNLDELSSIKQVTEQPSTSAVTPKSKKTPRGSRQTRSAKRKRPQDLVETTEEERENGNSSLNRTRTSPRKSSSTIRKAPRKRGKAQEKQGNFEQIAQVPSEKRPMTERVDQDTMPAEQRPQASPASLELIQIPGHSPPARQLIPWKIVRYKKVVITQRIKEVIENGELTESTIIDQVVNEEIIEKLEQEFRTPSPSRSSKTSSLTSGSLADISSFGSRTSSSVAGSLQKTSSNVSTGIQKSISLSSISEGNSSLDKTISLPGSEKTSPNVSGHEHSASGRLLTSPGGVVQQPFPAKGIRRRSLSGGTEHLPGITEESSRTGQAKSTDVSPSALMLSNRKRGKRMSSKGNNSSSVSPSDTEVRTVSDGKDAEFAKPKRTPSRKSVPRTPEQTDQRTHEQSSDARRHSSPPLNVSEGWNVEEIKQSSEESEGIPCAQPRKEKERISSDEKSDGDVGKLLQIETTTATSTTGESFEDKVDEPGPSNQEGSSTRPTRGKRRGKTQRSTPISIKQSLDDTIVVQDEEEGEMDAILTEPPLESRQQVSTSSDLTTDSAQAFLVPGVRVFTRWMDGFYYPGTIKSEEKNNRLKIAFDDGDMRSVNSKDIIIKDWLARGQSVMAELPDDKYSYPGIVIGYYRGSTPKDAGYYVETDNGKTEKYPREKVILSKDQANLLLTSCPSSSSGISDITLENLVDGPRHRSRLRTPDGDGVVRTPSKVVSRTPKRLPSPAITRSGGKRKADDKQPTEGAVSPKKKAKQLATRLLTTVASSPDLSKQGIGIRRSPRKQTPSTSTTSSPAKSLTSAATKGSVPSTPRTMEMVLGPFPNNKTLFKGMAFLLTQGDVKKRSKVDTSTSESDDDDDPDDIPFDKDYARRQIEAGGGVVLRDIEKSLRTQYKLFVIANTYCRTMKYMYALASNIPCISNLWIRDCSRMNKLQSHKAYRLQAGESVDGDVIEWKPNRMILSGLKVLVMSSHYGMETTWRSILMAAGCHIVARFPTINQLNRGGVPFDCNVMVTDPTCPRHILHRAQQLDMPVVSAEWVMQSLINGVRMPYDSHYKFAWDYKEKLK